MSDGFLQQASAYLGSPTGQSAPQPVQQEGFLGEANAFLKSKPKPSALSRNADRAAAAALSQQGGGAYHYDIGSAFSNVKSDTPPQRGFLDSVVGGLTHLVRAGLTPPDDRTVGQRVGEFGAGVQQATEPVITAIPNAIKRYSTNVSVSRGNGPIDPSIYETDRPTQIATTFADAFPYLVSGVGPVLGAAQVANIAGQFAQDPKKAAADLYEGVAPWNAKTPEEAAVRTLFLVGGAAHLAMKSPKVAGPVHAMIDEIRTGRAAPNPELIAQIVKAASVDDIGNPAPKTHAAAAPVAEPAPKAKGFLDDFQATSQNGPVIPDYLRRKPTPTAFDVADADRLATGAATRATDRGLPADTGGMSRSEWIDYHAPRILSDDLAAMNAAAKNPKKAGVATEDLGALKKARFDAQQALKTGKVPDGLRQELSDHFDDISRAELAKAKVAPPAPVALAATPQPPIGEKTPTPPPVTAVEPTVAPVEAPKPIAAEASPVDRTTPRPFGGFDPKGDHEQSVAREASSRTVKVVEDGKSAPYLTLRQKAADWLAARRKAGEQFDVPALGVKAKLSRESAEKLFKGDAVAQTLVPHIPELLDSAKLVYHEEMKRGSNLGGPNRVARLVARAETPDGPKDVWMTLRRANDGDYYYHHQYTEVEPAVVKPGDPHVESQLRPKRAQGDSTPQTVEKAPEGSKVASGEAATGLSVAQRMKEAETHGTAKPEAVSDLGLTEAHALGKADVESGAVVPDDLIKKLSKEKRAATPREYGAIAEGKRRIMAAINHAKDEHTAAIGTADEAAKSEAYKEALAKSDEFNAHLDRVKGASGSSLNALKIGTTIDHGNFAEVMAEARRRKGSAIDPTRERVYTDLLAQHKAAQERIKALEANARKEPTAKPDAEKAVRRRARSDQPRRSREAIHADRAAGKDELQKALLRSSAGSGVPANLPDVGRALAKIAHTYIEEGALTLSEVVDHVRGYLHESGIHFLKDGESADHIPEGEGIVRERDLYDALAGKHNEPAASAGEAKNRLQKLRTMARIASTMHDVIEGTYEPGKKAPPDAQVQAMRDALAQLKDEAGMDGRSIDQEARLHRNLKEALHTLVYGPDEVAAKIPDSPEAAAIRKKLEETRAKIEAKYGETPPEREARILSQLQSQLDRAREQLKTGERDPKKPKAIDPENIAAARAQLHDATRQLDVNDRIAQLEEQLKTKDFSATKAETAANKERLEALEANRSKELREAVAHRDLLTKVIKREIENEAPQTLGEKARIFLRAGRLTNPMARIFDVTSNATTYLDRQVGKPLEALSDRVLFPNQDRVSPGWSLDRAQAVAKGAGERWKHELIEQMTVGDDSLLKKIGSQDLRTKYGALNTVVNKINRFAGVTDIPFKDSIYEGAIRELAEARAKSELGKGATAKEISAARERIVEAAKDGTGYGDLHEIATNEAIEGIFGADSRGAEFISGVQNTAKRFAGDPGRLLLDLVVPFPRIFVNISGYGTDFLFGAGKAAKRAVEGSLHEGGLTIAQRRTINRLVGRNLRGLALLGIGYYGYKNGIIKPEQVDKQGNFVDWGDVANVLGPAGTIMLLGATSGIAEELSEQTKQGLNPTTREPYQDKGKKLLWNSAVDLIGNQPAISSPVRTYTDIRRDPIKASGKIASAALIPGLIREWAKRQDQFRNGVNRRKAKDFADEFKKNVPFVREGLPSGD